MSVSAAPPVPQVDLTLSVTTPSHGTRTFDLATRALVVAVVPMPRFGREAEVLAGVAAAAEAGADLAEVPAESRLLGPAVAQGAIPVVVRVETAAAAAQALAAGAVVLLVPEAHLGDVIGDSADAQAEDPSGSVRAGSVPPPMAWPVAVVVDTAQAGRDAVAATPSRPVLVDVTRLSGPDAVSEESLALAVGVRLVRTTDLRRTRRVVEVMAHLLAARR